MISLRTPRPARLLALAALPTLALALPGCGAVDAVKDKVNDTIGSAASGLVESKVRDELKSAGIDLKSGPTCKADSSSGDVKSVDISCTGETTDNEAVKGGFSAKIEGTNCSGRIFLKVGSKDIIKDQTFDACRSS